MAAMELLQHDEAPTGRDGGCADDGGPTATSTRYAIKRRRQSTSTTTTATATATTPPHHPHATTAPLLALPPELLEQIALHLATRPPNLGPPSALLPLLSTCRTLHARLGWGNNWRFWTSIARAKFAFSSSPSPGNDHARDAHALRERLAALRIIRAGDPHARGAAAALKIAHGMLLEDRWEGARMDFAALDIALGRTTAVSADVGGAERDAKGKNRRQLLWAGAREFALRFVLHRLYEGRGGRGMTCVSFLLCVSRADGCASQQDTRPEHRTPAWRVGWPRDTEGAAAALWVMWFFESEETLAAESDSLRRQLMALLLPIVVAPFRYASALAPPHHYTIPLLPAVFDSSSSAQHTPGQGAITVPTNHGAFPLYALGAPSRSRSRPSSPSRRPRPRPHSPALLAKRHLLHPSSPSPPPKSRHRLLCAPPARLLFFARMQAGARMGVPPHLPRDRAAAHARWLSSGGVGAGPIGPTQEDIWEKNARPLVRFERQVGAGRASRGVAVDPGLEDGDDDTSGEDRWAPYRWRARLCTGYGDGYAASSSSRCSSSPTIPPTLPPSAPSPLAAPTPTWTRTPSAAGGAPPGRISRVYTPGSFAGLWAGTMLMPSEPAYTALLATPGGALPPNGLTGDDFAAAARPVYMRIAEHWSFHPATPAPPPAPDSFSADEGIRGGWFAPGARVERVGGGRVEVRGPGAGGEGASAHSSPPPSSSSQSQDTDTDTDSAPWPEWDAPAWAEHGFDEDDTWAGACDGVQDVIFTGETDPSHGAAWHHYEYAGRVRPWDGLIGLVMRPRDRALGLATFFISGHLVGRDTFEGTWQMASQDVLVPSWGGSICLARGEE
ncbi:hypothetical protein B0H19DRAFT_1274738 [Mycena capillaripes]|nr:hypothetical protein B0H19DRAFT_1274738 [Mycena capillaripes]